ncbi:heterocyst development glycosyltransferase HepC [Pleurocapsa sp. PCC 7319]|uniref:heterocyst development glycosyltransferase HepC n=1 Tax=Pleurocapsa sp. PCC 7319 TaxID=118161 RepID=UPI00034CD56D|nr:heterocyst development glycosyltransferase HepC [Pleurocapsa sp. PCC 7319]
MTTNIVLHTSKVLTLDLDPSRVESYLPACDLKWRQKNLWVKSISVNSHYSFPALTRRHWLENCLCNSWVKRVCVDRALGEQGIKLWADTCHQADKPIFIRLASHSELPNCRQTTYWRVKRTLDWLASLILLVILSPLMLLVAILIKIFDPGPIFFSQWRVGERGKLFRMFKFRTMIINAEQQHHAIMTNQNDLHKCKDDPRITALGKWLRKYSLDELPQLFNVIRGEMSLVGPRPWALYDALRLDEADKKRLNALPGITGAWQVQERSQLLDLHAVTKCDFEYLHNWSLIGDLKILLLTIPKVLVGFGAY